MPVSHRKPKRPSRFAQVGRFYLTRRDDLVRSGDETFTQMPPNDSDVCCSNESDLTQRSSLSDARSRRQGLKTAKETLAIPRNLLHSDRKPGGRRAHLHGRLSLDCEDQLGRLSSTNWAGYISKNVPTLKRGKPSRSVNHLPRKRTFGTALLCGLNGLRPLLRPAHNRLLEKCISAGSRLPASAIMHGASCRHNSSGSQRPNTRSSSRCLCRRRSVSPLLCLLSCR